MNFKYLFLSLLTTGLIAFVSSLPNHSLPGDGSLSEQIISNLAHIPAYGLLTFLWLKTFEKGLSKSQLLKKINALILIGLILFAVSDEIHQSFIPGRTASYVDVALNVIGILCGLSLFSAKGGFLPRAMLAPWNLEYIQLGRGLFHWGIFCLSSPPASRCEALLAGGKAET